MTEYTRAQYRKDDLPLEQIKDIEAQFRNVDAKQKFLTDIMFKFLVDNKLLSTKAVNSPEV